MKDFFAFLKTRVFWINFGIYFLLLSGGLFWVYNYLDKYSLHGESITVPDLRGMDTVKVKEFLSDKNLRVVVSDSSVYEPRKPKGSILDHDPPPGAKVKENRTIYLVINRSLPMKVAMPNLVDASLRQAEAMLDRAGLKIGVLSYEPDLALNAVLIQEFRGQPIAPGTMIVRGSKIDLTLGDGLGSTRILVPDLIGLPLAEAIEMLKSSMLNEGAIVPDVSVSDTMAAVVYRQIPTSAGSKTINQGDGVDIFITQDSKKLPKPKVNPE